MKAQILILLLFGISALAKKEWICVEAASRRVGDEFQSCGIGTGKDESEARLKAFEHAKLEFDNFCNASDDCKNHNVTVDPKRTTCEQVKDEFKCYRMVAFSILKTMKTGNAKPGDAQLFAGGAGEAVTGKADRDEISKVISSHLNSIRVCYTKELKKHRHLHGKLILFWQIGRGGKVTRASKDLDELGDSQVANCVLNQLRTWRFPAPPNGQAVDVSYPLFFSR